MKHLQPVPQPLAESRDQVAECRPCKRKDKRLTELHAENVRLSEENVRLLRALRREADAHLDQRTDKSARDYVFRRK